MTTSMIDEILAQIPADDLAAQLGTDPDTAMDAARKALPALLGGLSSNVAAGGGDALGAALQRDHDGSLLEVSNPLAASDPVDGGKIVGHIFGDQQDQVIERLGAASRGGSSIFSKLLPLLAPLVMAWLAKKVGGSLSGGTSGAGAASEAQGGGGLGSILGQLGGSGSSGSSGGDLSSILGGLFGGENADSAGTGSGSTAGSGGGLGDLLGGLLGREVETGKSSTPELGDLFDILGGEADSGA
jgi:hypothetical protein